MRRRNFRLACFGLAIPAFAPAGMQLHHVAEISEPSNRGRVSVHNQSARPMRGTCPTWPGQVPGLPLFLLIVAGCSRDWSHLPCQAPGWPFLPLSITGACCQFHMCIRSLFLRSRERHFPHLAPLLPQQSLLGLDILSFRTVASRLSLSLVSLIFDCLRASPCFCVISSIVRSRAAPYHETSTLVVF